MRILGISAYYHDSAAALVEDGDIVAAAQEERFSRKKHDADFPVAAIEYCLAEADVMLSDVDYVTFYDKPFLKFERLLETYLSFAPKGLRSFLKAMPVWLGEKLFQKDKLFQALKSIDPDFTSDKLLFSTHHQSHAASAFFPSPFESAVVLTMDGVGEWATASVAIGADNSLETVKEIHFPHSLGLLYSAVTYYLGFKVNAGEYKVMGLAPYGDPNFSELMMSHLIDIKPDGSFRMDMGYFDYSVGLTMTNARFAKLFGEPVRSPDDDLTQFHMDMAASVQAVTEEVVLRMARSLARETGADNLCLAGGVALNCVANGKVLRDGAFKKVWVQPAAGDAGGALGAAMAAYYTHLKQPRTVTHDQDAMKGGYLGPFFHQSEIEQRLAEIGADFVVLDDVQVIEATARILKEGEAVGWFQGRMEFGPRALGARSILADPRSPVMQKNLNLKVKYRESFRPFAPSVLRDDVADWFELDHDSPYMLFVANVKEEHRTDISDKEQNLFGIEKLNFPRSSIPAITHVDYSARVQTVHKETNPKYHALISKFKEITGCPVLVNTSFNVRGEPIVCSPEDAYRCFMGTELDALVVGNCFMRKIDQTKEIDIKYKEAFEPD